MPVTFAPGKRRVTVYVIFHGSPFGGFWTLWCPPAWRHCFLLVSVYFPHPHAFARRYTMKLEPTAWGLDLDVIWRAPEEVAREYYLAGATAIVKQTVDLPPKQIFALRGLLTCVSVIKSALGIKAWCIIFPKQLFRHLIHGGAELVDWPHGETADANVFEAQGSGPGPGDAASATGSGAPAG